MLTKLNEHSENFNKENIRKYQREVTGLKNIVTKWKNLLEWFNGKLEKADKTISKLENKAMGLRTQKEKKIKCKYIKGPKANQIE